ncbi:MAG: hypothetical protein HOM55_03325 [Proteobacteria bacterium]|nr:hypothetical protein [Pseudomonadota bacterium]
MKRIISIERMLFWLKMISALNELFVNKATHDLINVLHRPIEIAAKSSHPLWNYICWYIEV